MRNPWILMAPAAVLVLAFADRAAERVVRGHGHAHDDEYVTVGDAGARPRLRVLPTLRALVVQLWMVRVDAAIRTGRFHLALRHVREALAIAPDLPSVRIRLADILAYNLPAQEPDPARRLAWIGEGLAVLEDGIERDPFDARLHANRGLLLRSRGDVYPEFEAAFRATTGASTLEAAVDAFVRGAECARGDTLPIRWASIYLESRGDDRLRRARAGDRPLFEGARADYARQADLLRELLVRSRLARSLLERDLAYAEASVELVDRLAAGATEGDERVAELEAVRVTVVEERQGEWGELEGR